MGGETLISKIVPQESFYHNDKEKKTLLLEVSNAYSYQHFVYSVASRSSRKGTKCPCKRCCQKRFKKKLRISLLSNGQLNALDNFLVRGLNSIFVGLMEVGP